jgi:hypothetical protein
VDVTPSNRALAVGLAVGALQQLFGTYVVQDLASTTSRNGMILDSLVATLLLLAVIPGLALYAGTELDWAALPVTRLAALVGLGTGVAVAVTDPAFSAMHAGVPMSELYQTRYLGMWLVNGISPGVYAAVGVLAGELYGRHEAAASFREQST